MLKYAITETRIDDTFLTSQFSVNGLSVSYRLGRNRNGDAIMIFIRDDIPRTLLTKHVLPDIEDLFV